MTDADKIFYFISDANVLALAFLAFVFFYAGQHLSTPNTRYWAHRIFALTFLFYCLYGFLTEQPDDVTEFAVLTCYGLLASSMAFGIASVFLPVLTFFLIEPLGGIRKSIGQYLRRHSERLAERRKIREEEEAERQLADQPPSPTTAQLIKQQMEDVQNEYNLSLELIANSSLDGVEKRAAEKKAKRRFTIRMDELLS